MRTDEKLNGKALAKFDTLNAAEAGMDETGREYYWVAPDGRVYESMIFSDGACWITCESSTLMALYELQTTIEALTDGFWETSMEKVERDAKTFADSFRAALKAIRFKPLEQEKF